MRFGEVKLVLVSNRCVSMGFSGVEFEMRILRRVVWEVISGSESEEIESERRKEKELIKRCIFEVVVIVKGL